MNNLPDAQTLSLLASASVDDLRLSGWIGCTLVLAETRYSTRDSPPPCNFPPNRYSYLLTDQEQRHSIHLSTSDRLTPTRRISAKNLFGSGFPIASALSPALRVTPYEPLGLRIDKSWP